MLHYDKVSIRNFVDCITRETPPFPIRDVPIVKKPFLLSEREDLHYRDKILLEKLLPTD